MLLTLLSLVIVLGVLIFVHELGHFLVAKAVGIQVLRFSLGFGRPVIAWTRGETEYWISWIPLGGYVKMAGLEDEGMAGELEGGKSAVPIDPERSFEKKSLWARMAVILAGVTMNILLAFFIYSGLAAVSGVRVRSAIQVDTVLARALPPGTEALTGLARGDRILRINGDSVKSWTDLQTSLIKVDSTASLEIAGRAEPITVRLPADTAARVRLVTWGLLPLEPARIGMVFPGEPGARGGLKTGDVVIRAGGDSVRSWNDLVFKLWYSAGKEVPLTVVRDGRTVNLTVTPRAQTDEDKTSARPRPYGFIAAEGDFPESRERLPVLTSIKFGALQTAGQIGLVVGSVKRLVLGQASVKEVGGPIMIAQVSGQAVRLGLDRFLMFIAFFSVSLAVLNLLPIPVLDGGHAVFLIAEGIRRKPLSPQLRLRLTQIGMLIVLAIMILAISNDVIRTIR
jgi:regulator of sigma E protease